MATVQPQPVGIGLSTMLNSLWGYISSVHMTGDQVDALRESQDGGRAQKC